MGIDMYLDEADHVGIDDQPFYYGGMLNVFKMRSSWYRMDLSAVQALRKASDFHEGRTHALRARAAGRSALLPSERVGADRVLGRREFQPRRESAAKRVEASRHAACRRNGGGVQRLRAVPCGS